MLSFRASMRAESRNTKGPVIATSQNLIVSLTAGRTRLTILVTSKPMPHLKNRYFVLFTLQAFRSLLGSYALLLLLPLLVSFLLYAASVTRIKEETAQSNRISLTLLAEVVDSRLEDLFIAADQITFQGRARPIAQADPSVTVTQRLAMTEIQNTLRQVRQSNAFLAGVYFLFPHPDYLLSDISRYRADEMDSMLRTEFGVPPVEWKTLVMAGPYRQIVALPLRPGDRNPRLLVIQKCYFGGYADPSAALVFLIDESSLTSLVETVRGLQQIRLALVLPGGVWRSHPEGPVPEWLRWGNLSPSYQQREVFVDSSRSMVSSMGPSRLPIRYVSQIPLDLYSGSVSFITLVMVLYMVLCLAGGVVLSYWMARKHFTPIRRMTALFLERLGAQETDVDFRFLEDSLKGLLHENADLEATIRNQKETLKSTFLARMSRAHPFQVPSLLESYAASGITVDHERFILVAAALDDTKDGNALIGYMVAQVFEELLGTRHQALVGDLGTMTLCLVEVHATPEEDPGWEHTTQELVVLCDRVREIFTTKFDSSLSCVVGTVRTPLSEVPTASAEVERVVEFVRLFEKRNQTHLADSLDSGPPLSGSMGIYTIYRSVADKVYSRDFREAAAEVKRYLASELSDGRIRLETARLRMSAIANMVSEVVSELRPGKKDELFDSFHPLQRLAEAKSVPDLHRQIDSLFASLESQWGNTEDTGETWFGEIQCYVQENFRDTNLCVNAIADHFEVSVPHLSRSFRRQAGMGLLDYIHWVRVREAKTLLTGESLSIEEVARRVGCGSRVTLTRAFKRYEGVVPGSFKKEAEQ